MITIDIKKVTNYESSIEVHLNALLEDIAYISGIYEKNGVELPTKMLKITNANVVNSRQRLNQIRQPIMNGMNIYRFKIPNQNSRWSASTNLIVVIYDKSEKEINRLATRCPPKNRPFKYENKSKVLLESNDEELERIEELRLLNEKIRSEDNKISEIKAELQKHKKTLADVHDKKRKLQQIST